MCLLKHPALSISAKALRQLVNDTLSQTLHDEASIEKLRALVAAELVEAILPPPGKGTQATVTRITPLGRATAATEG